MCGVIGAIRGNAAPGLSLLMHRGIRSTVATKERGTLAHVRLPIVGIGPEYDQPVERGPWTIAFVGEVLNFREIQPELECDLELVVDTWNRTGARGFRQFDGFWTVMAIDDRTGALHVLTDYLAQKPAYYRSDDHAIAAASEPDAVAALGPTTPDPIYLSSVIKWGYCPETWRTPYREIRKTLPGEHVTLHPSGHVGHKTADPLEPQPWGGADMMKARIEKAVRRRVLSSDVPVAALVSGGLDSAITYVLAQRYGDIQAYHAENGEAAAAQRVVRNRGAIVLNHANVPLTQALKYMQEPVDLGSLLPQVALSDGIKARGAERVCLSGDGADEFFGGYGRASRYDSQGSDVWHELVAWHLPRLDRVMMRNQIEVRSPFLGRWVAGMALSIPKTLRANKRVLREAFRDDLPEGVADTPKRPLRTPSIENDRETHSKKLVALFERDKWPNL